jgi:hypothetical protein
MNVEFIALNRCYPSSVVRQCCTFCLPTISHPEEQTSGCEIVGKVKGTPSFG